AVVLGAVVSTGARRKGHAVGGGPKPYALPTAAGGEVAQVKGVKGVVPNDDGVAIVGAVPGADGRGRTTTGAGPGSAAIGGPGIATVARRRHFGVIVVGDDSHA